MAGITIRAHSISLVAIRKFGSDCEVLLLKRTQSLAGEWCQIAGSIEEGETAWQTAVRELKEETSLSPELFYSADVVERFYEAADDAITLVPVFVAIIDPAAKVVLNHEHSEYRWVSFTEAKEMVAFGGQRWVLRQIEEEFARRTPSKHLQINI